MVLLLWERLCTSEVVPVRLHRFWCFSVLHTWTSGSSKCGWTFALKPLIIVQYHTLSIMITWTRMTIVLFYNESSKIPFLKHSLFPFFPYILSSAPFTSLPFPCLVFTFIPIHFHIFPPLSIPSYLIPPHPVSSFHVLPLSRTSSPPLPFPLLLLFPPSLYLLYFILCSIYLSFSCCNVFVHLLTFTVLSFISISTCACVAEATDNLRTNTSVLARTWATFIDFYEEKKR